MKYARGPALHSFVDDGFVVLLLNQEKAKFEQGQRCFFSGLRRVQLHGRGGPVANGPMVSIVSITLVKNGPSS